MSGMTAVPDANFINTSPPPDVGPATQWFEDLRSAASQTLGMATDTTLTIAGGTVAPTLASHVVETEGGAAADDLANIDPTNIPDGRILIIRCANSAHVVTVKNAAGGTGQILLSDGADYLLNATKRFLVLKLKSNTWEELFRSLAGDLGSAAKLTAGTAANNLMQLDGSARAPAVDASQMTHTGKLIGMTIYATPGTFTYTKNTAAVRVELEVVAGGGQGGGAAATGPSTQTAGAGGSGGGYSRKSVLNSTLSTSTTVTVGAGGSTGAAGAAGQNGGSSSFGSVVSATPGTGGLAGATPSSGTGPNSSVMATAGIGSSGDTNLPGGFGDAGMLYSGAGPISGAGGRSFFGPGGAPVLVTGDGNPGVAPGSGGSGAGNQGSAAAHKGGAGAPGMVIVREYDA